MDGGHPALAQLALDAVAGFEGGVQASGRIRGDKVMR